MMAVDRLAAEVHSFGAPDDARWDAYVDAHPHRSAYHYAGWPRLIARAFSHDAVLLAAAEGSRIIGVLPLIIMRSRVFGRFVVSLPLLNEGGLLADDTPAEARLIGAAIDVARRANADYLELRHTRRHSATLAQRQHKVAMTLALRPTAAEQWQSLDRKVRNQIRKGEKSDLALASGGSELIDAFYHVFARNMRDLGTPVFGVSLFRETLSTFPANSRVFCVRHNGVFVAASIVHWRGDSMEVIWASALREANPICANVLLYWHMLQFAIEQGCRRFEFGRCTPGEGTFHFKRQWGAVPTPLVWEYWTPTGAVPAGFDPRADNRRWAVSMWRRLPLPVATAVGPHIVRGIPC